MLVANYMPTKNDWRVFGFIGFIDEIYEFSVSLLHFAGWNSDFRRIEEVQNLKIKQRTV
jgi:hypothetical protein